MLDCITEETVTYAQGFDREHLKMPPNQLELIREVCKVQKNSAQ